MSDIAKPKVAFVMPAEPEEYKPKDVDSMKPKSDSHMALKISPPADEYFSADSRSHAEEEDHLISQDNTDLEAKRPKATGLRSRKVIIAVAVVAVLLIVGAIICKFMISYCQHGPPSTVDQFFLHHSGSLRGNYG